LTALGRQRLKLECDEIAFKFPFQFQLGPLHLGAPRGDADLVGVLLRVPALCATGRRQGLPPNQTATWTGSEPSHPIKPPRGLDPSPPIPSNGNLDWLQALPTNQTATFTSPKPRHPSKPPPHSCGRTLDGGDDTRRVRCSANLVIKRIPKDCTGTHVVCQPSEDAAPTLLPCDTCARVPPASEAGRCRLTLCNPR
jgi:hypothetical protein